MVQSFINEKGVFLFTLVMALPILVPYRLGVVFGQLPPPEAGISGSPGGGTSLNGVTVSRSTLTVTLNAGETTTERLYFSAPQRTRVLVRGEITYDEGVLASSRRLLEADKRILGHHSILEDAVDSTKKFLRDILQVKARHGRWKRKTGNSAEVISPSSGEEVGKKQEKHKHGQKQKDKVIIDVRNFDTAVDKKTGEEIFPTDRVLVGWRCNSDHQRSAINHNPRRRLEMKKRILYSHMIQDDEKAGSSSDLGKVAGLRPIVKSGRGHRNHQHNKDSRNRDEDADLIFDGVCEIDLVKLKDPTLEGIKRLYDDILSPKNDEDDHVALLSPDLPLILSSGSAKRLDWAFPDDPLFPAQWYNDACPPLEDHSCTNDPNVDMDSAQAWAISESSNGGGSNTTIPVAVLDTGVNYRHPDLIGRMWTNEKELHGLPNVDDDNNGYVDDFVGWNFYNNNNNPLDDNGHGSHVSGIISASRNNGIGIAGIADASRIMALKVLGGSGAGNLSGHLEAVTYAVDNGARVINNSLGSHPNLPTEAMNRLRDLMKPAMIYALDTIFVTAAGNSGMNISVFPEYPASLIGDWTLTVASHDIDGRISTFSNYGPENVHLAAPGANITSTYTGEKYMAASGTSMACPMAAGVAALVLSQNPSLQPQQVVDILIQSVRVARHFADKTISGGRLNAYRALTLEPQFFFAPSTQDVIVTPSGPTPVHFVDIHFFTRRLSEGIYKGTIVVKWYREIFGRLRPYSIGIPVEMVIKGKATETIPQIVEDYPLLSSFKYFYKPPPRVQELPGPASPTNTVGPPIRNQLTEGVGFEEENSDDDDSPEHNKGKPHKTTDADGDVFWVANECLSPVNLIVRFFDTRFKRNEWSTLCWGSVQSGLLPAPRYLLEDSSGILRSLRKDWYFYASAQDDSATWQGTEAKAVCSGNVYTLRQGKVDIKDHHFLVLNCQEETTATVTGLWGDATNSATITESNPSKKIYKPRPVMNDNLWKYKAAANLSVSNVTTSIASTREYMTAEDVDVLKTQFQPQEKEQKRALTDERFFRSSSDVSLRNMWEGE